MPFTGAASMDYLSQLPNELLLGIGRHLDSDRDISSLSRLNRDFHWLFFDYLFGFCFKQRSSARYLSNKNYLLRLFFHAARHNSANIIQWLTFRTDELNVREYVNLYELYVG